MNHTLRRCPVMLIAVFLLLTFAPRHETAAGPVALTPEQTALQAFQAIAANRPERIFDLLPASYQNDIEEVIVAFASNTDAVSWNQARGLLNKISRVLTTQQVLLAEALTQHIPNSDEPGALKEGIAALGLVTGHLGTSGMSDIQRLQQGNLRQLLAEDGHTLMKALEKAAGTVSGNLNRPNMWSTARSATVEVLASDGDAATIRTVVGEETEDIDLMRVDGRWIPAEMAEGWQESIASQRRTIASMATPEGQQQQQMATMMVGMVDGFLTQIEQAGTAEEIDRIISGAMMLLMGGGTMQQ